MDNLKTILDNSYTIGSDNEKKYESKIKYSISAMINIEKKLTISLVEIVRHLTQIYSKKFLYTGGFFEDLTRNNQKLKIEIYGDAWDEAYLRAIADKLVENCYRNVAVNLLDRMVEKLLEMTMDIINKKHAEHEKNKITEKIIKLNELKKIISGYIQV